MIFLLNLIEIYFNLFYLDDFFNLYFKNLISLDFFFSSYFHII